MIGTIPERRQFLQGFEVLADDSDLFDHSAKLRAVIGRLLDFLKFLERRFYPLADDGHLAANVARQLLDRSPQRIESLGRVAACVLLVSFRTLALVRHGVSYRSIPRFWLRPRARLCSMLRARLSLCRT